MGILAYYVSDAAWGIFAGLDWRGFLYADTILFFLSLVAFVVMWCRFTVDYLHLAKWQSRILSWAGLALLAFNVAALSANPKLDAFEWRLALDALSQNGMAEAAYGLLMERGGAVDRGAAISWLWRNAAGIASDPTCAGFRNIILAPRPDRRLGFVKAEYKSAAGVVKSVWRYEGGKWIWDFTVPRISTASVTLPGQNITRHYDAGDHHIELDI